METQRLYFEDAYLTAFAARVVARGELGGHPAVALDRSAFYPEGGGQAADRGTLNGIAVRDVQRQGALVWHAIDTMPEDDVVGVIDWARRFDLMQQHHGQHLLSAAFVEVLGATTLAVHMGETTCSLDVDRAALTADEVAAVEARANAIVWEDRPVEARFVSADELATLPLRKDPSVSGPVRVVIVPGFDYSACGGTHPRSTGSVGIVVVPGWERYKGGTRLSFACGGRALTDYRRQNGVLRRLVGEASVGADELPQTMLRLREEAMQARRALAQAQEHLATYEARRLYDAAPAYGAARVVRALFEGRALDDIRLLARAIAAFPGGFALLGTRDAKAQLVFVRAADAPGDMGALLRVAAPLVGGKGGGQPTQAQGGGSQAAGLEAALDAAEQAYRALIG
jgi:alanyl-tRNA synthetase